MTLRLASNSPLAILFPPTIASLPKASHTKKPFPSESQRKKPQSKGKNPKTKAWHPPSVSLLYPGVNRVEQQFSEGA
jgi:hypothetical protein